MGEGEYVSYLIHTPSPFLSHEEYHEKGRECIFSFLKSHLKIHIWLIKLCNTVNYFEIFLNSPVSFSSQLHFTLGCGNNFHQCTFLVFQNYI